MLNNLVKTTQIGLLGTLIALGCSQSIAAESMTLQRIESIIESIAETFTSNSPFVEFLQQNKNDILTLEQQKTESPASSAAISQPSLLQRLKARIRNIFQAKSYIAFSDSMQKVVSLLQSHPVLFEKLTKETDALDILYRYSQPEQQKLIKEWTQKAYESQAGKKLQQSLVQLILLKTILPGWAYQADGWANGKQTQSKPHFFENAHSTLSLIKNASDEMRKTLVAVYKKEQEERAKGNYVFYHAQRWDLHLSADIYKQLWNLTKNDSVGNDFTFFRFNQPTQALNNRSDYLFMNHALFGNSRRGGSCTVQYFMENYSIYRAFFTAEKLCNDLNLSHYYNKYKADFDHLEQLHNQANTTGNLMLISIPANKLNFVRPVWPGGSPRTVRANNQETSDTQTILDTLISNPKSIVDSDDIEYTMPLTTEYVLDPHNGPRVYSFNAADDAKLTAYETMRDELFAKIKYDIQANSEGLSS